MESPNNQEGNEVGKPGFAPRSHSTQAIVVSHQVGRQRKAAKVRGSTQLGIVKTTLIRVQRLYTDLFQPEIMLLCGVVCHLQTIGKMTTNKEELFRWLGYRAKPATRRALRRLESLADKGYLLRVLNKTGAVDRRGYGFALSERGHGVVMAIDREWDKSAQWITRVRQLKDVVLYLDQAHKVLRKNQQIILMPATIEQLKSIQV